MDMKNKFVALEDMIEYMEENGVIFAEYNLNLFINSNPTFVKDLSFIKDVYITQPLSFVKFYVLQNYDGADGRNNTASGMITSNEEVVNAWVKKCNGNTWQYVAGVVVNSLDEIGVASKEVQRQKALSKLTHADKVLLGLV